MKLANNLRLDLRLDEYHGRDLFINGTGEYYLVRVLERLISPGDTVVDVGANIGEHTLRAALRVGGDGTVYSLEPQPDVFADLQANVAANGFQDRVVLLCAAASDQAGTGILARPRTASNRGLATLERTRPRFGPDLQGAPLEEVSVPLVRLDDVLGQVHACRVSVLKLDVEGHERAVLDGAGEVIANSRPAVLFEADVDPAAWSASGGAAAALLEAGYRIFGISGSGSRWQLEDTASSVRVATLSERWKAPDHPINLVGLHPGDPRLPGLLDTG